jgi:hypothetical protein
VVEAIAISPEEAMATVDGYMSQSWKRHPTDSEWDHKIRVADKIIQRYSKYAMVVGAATGLPAVVPGLGTLVSAAGSAVADAAVSMKLQVDMCMCLAQVFGNDVSTDEGRYLAFLIAATGSVQREVDEDGVRVGSEAGVDMVRSYLRGAALQAVKQAFRKFGVSFTRKAFQKAIPFGVGVFIGGSANYALTRHVGREAKQWFIIDSVRQDDSPLTTVDRDATSNRALPAVQ